MKAWRSMFTFMVLLVCVLLLTSNLFAVDKEFLKSTVKSAAVGAVASEMSDGNAGKGALVGAGAGIVGDIILDKVFPENTCQEPQLQRPKKYQSRRVVYYDRQPTQEYDYDNKYYTYEDVRESYREGYNRGYRLGFQDGCEYYRLRE